MRILNVTVVDANSIPEDILENGILAQYEYVPTDGYCRWFTSWRNSEGGNTICSNSADHTALSHYMIENGCSADEEVILSF
jgi:hypothetical protein